MLDLKTHIIDHSVGRAVHGQVTANNFDHACNTSERIADFMGKPGREFSECGQMFRTRHLGGMLPFHFFSALAQLLDHAVKATTDFADSVVAISKAYRDIEITFPKAHNLAMKFQHNKLQIITTVSCA